MSAKKDAKAEKKGHMCICQRERDALINAMKNDTPKGSINKNFVLVAFILFAFAASVLAHHPFVRVCVCWDNA